MQLCLKKARLLCSPSSYSLVMGSFSLGSPMVDIHMVKPASGPELLAALNPMHLEALSMPPLMSLASNLFRLPTVDSTSSLSLSPSSSRRPPPLLGPHNLVTPHLKLHPSSLMFLSALG